MSYRDTTAMHRAMYMGPIVMALFTLGFTTMRPVGRLFSPNLEVGDLAVPEMMIELLPGPLAGRCSRHHWPPSCPRSTR